MRTVAIVAMLAITTLDVSAQAWRCSVDGRVVFQQAPCTGGSQVAPGAVAPATAAPATGSALCERHARAAGTFNDPDSVRIGRVTYVGARKFVIHDATIAARTYQLVINARNAYGGYDGDTVYECQLSEDEARLLKFARAAGPQRQPPASER